MTRGEQPAEHPFARAPVLSMLCALAGITGLLVGRLLVPALYEHASDAVVGSLVRLSDLSLNVVAVSCLVALSLGLFAALRRPRFASLAGRITIAMFSGLFLPTIVLVAVLPRAATTVKLVAYAGWSASLLSLLLAVAAAVRPNPPTTRLLLAAPALATLASFVALAADQWVVLARLSVAPGIAQGAMVAAEVAWVAIPAVAALTLRVQWNDPRARVALALGALAFFAIDGVFAWSAALLRQSYPDILYYAIRGRVFVDRWPSLYGGVAGLYAMVATVALASRDVARRQTGVALLLFFGAGITPRMPATIALTVLGMMLLARTVVALSPEPVDPPEPPVAAPEGV